MVLEPVNIQALAPTAETSLYLAPSGLRRACTAPSQEASKGRKLTVKADVLVLRKESLAHLLHIPPFVY